MEVRVSALNDGGVGVFAGLVFEGLEQGKVFAVFAYGEVEGGASGGGVVVDEDDAAVAEAYGVDAGVGVGEIERVGLAPGDAVVEGVGGADMGDVAGGAGVEAQVVFAEVDDGGLDDSGDVLGAGLLRRFQRCGRGHEAAGYGDGTEFVPGGSVVGAAVDPGGPGGVTLDGGSADDGAVVEDEGLVLDGTEEAGGEMLGGGPGLALIGADQAGSAPLAGVAAELVVEPEAAVVGFEEHGIPAGDVGLAHEKEGSGPAGGGAAGAPDGYVVGALFGSAEPCGDDVAVLQLHEGGGVCGGEGGGGVDELLGDRCGRRLRDGGKSGEQGKAKSGTEEILFHG